MAKKSLVSFYKINNSQLSSLPIKEGQLIITKDNNRIYLDITDQERIELESYDLEVDGSDKYKLTFTYPDGTTKAINLTGLVRDVSTGTTNGTILVDTDGTSTEVSVAGLKALAFKDTIDTSEITSGVLPIVRGGTGAETFASGEALIGSGTSAIRTKRIDTTDGGTTNSTDLISSGAVKAGLDTKIPLSQKGANNGVATLGSDGKVPAVQLPSFVDDVLEYPTLSDFPATGEEGKIYVTLDTNLTYRWTGSTYVEISQSLALGETSTTAYRGDRGKIAYDHATDADKITSAVGVGLYKVGATSDGHIAGLSGIQKADITALGIPAQDTTYTAGTGIDITNNVISNTQTSAEWGNITGDINDQTDLINLINNSGFVVDKITGSSYDLNNATTTGFYYIDSNNITTLTNMPNSCTSGWLMVLKVANATEVKQVFYKNGAAND